ncbi:flavodoxin domain-containing protein [Streptomyces griseosporeus]|uniref:flavodoxin domain-containing protein n=1 Tax=Streptomyces griseosporeus TaxID=1910 RepID=UPI00167DCE5D|nr:flavodoxin domain-containing protein [Streptomyces griseosporeus]GHF37520.1 flavodoxin [Streptomyces griseosporeus]
MNAGSVKDVLVAYATAYGSTREIAERLAAHLSERGLAAEAKAVRDVHDVTAYRAFVVGSAVHRQAWLRPAKDFLRDNADAFATRPLWLFSVGMPAALRGPWRYLAPKESRVIVEDLPGTLPHHAHRMFSGVVTPAQLPRLGRLLFRLLGGRFGDYRDWNAIDAWAVEIAGTLLGRSRRGVSPER